MFDPVIESRSNAIAYAHGDQIITVPLHRHSISMVMRDRFDAYLLAHARAEVRQGAAVVR